MRRFPRRNAEKQGIEPIDLVHEAAPAGTHLARGVRVGKSALQAFGAKHGIRPYRPTYRFPRGDPAKQAATREEIADLKKGRRLATSSC